MEPVTEKDAFTHANEGYLPLYEVGRLTQEELESLNKHPVNVDFYRYISLKKMLSENRLHEDSKFQDAKPVFELLADNIGKTSGTSGTSDIGDIAMFFFLTRGYLLQADIPSLSTEIFSDEKGALTTLAPTNPEFRHGYRIHLRMNEYISNYKEYLRFHPDIKDLIQLVGFNVTWYITNQIPALVDRFRTYNHLIGESLTSAYQTYVVWGVAIPDIDPRGTDIVQSGINTFPMPSRTDELYKNLYIKSYEYLERAITLREDKPTPYFNLIHTNPDFDIIKLLEFSEEKWFEMFPEIPYDHRLTFIMEKETFT